MTLTVEAVYQNGVLKPKRPLSLAEGAEVRLIVSAGGEDPDPLEGDLRPRCVHVGARVQLAWVWANYGDSSHEEVVWLKCLGATDKPSF